MTYNVFGGTLNLTQSINQTSLRKYLGKLESNDIDVKSRLLAEVHVKDSITNGHHALLMLTGCASVLSLHDGIYVYVFSPNGNTG